MKLCYIQETCPDFEPGDNKPPNNDVRTKYPCVKSLRGVCEMDINLRLHHGETIACNIEKIREIKEGLK